ncbi:O-antigen translocase [Shewanella sp. SM34]|uniref:O-antigen translocase n=1 Tax=unclassified Shewanella TaxID=196818 RepID=UPI0021D89EF1|nr:MULTISPECIES: O-antigen translocase [unclassified Shewanella]MCU8055567.1 O-antigen translocase [Shewanella sp. SM35]MCU8064489.1 O-antigen translocase [Shewanella sp. SM34]
MNILKTSILSGLSTLIGMISGFIITKVIAVYVGPGGMAVVGQLQNFINISMLTAGGFLKTALVKFTAEFSNDISERNSYWSAAFRIVCFFNLFSFTLLFFFAEELSNLILKSNDYEYVFKIFAFSLPLFIFNTIFVSILNGLSKIKKFILLNIVLNIVSLILVTTLSYFFQLPGALIAYVTNQSFVLLFTFIYLRNESWFKLSNFCLKPKYESYVGLFGIALITIFAVISSNLSMIYIRNLIVENISIDDAGYWQGIWTLSQVVLSLVTMAFSTYLLPKLSTIARKDLIYRELLLALQLILPITILIAFFMYFFRNEIILVLFTNEFKLMADLFLPQMFGNVIKVIGWLFGYVLVSKGMVKYTVISEVFFGISWCLLTNVFIIEFGLIGACYAFIVNNIFHALTMYILFKFKVK